MKKTKEKRNDERADIVVEYVKFLGQMQGKYGDDGFLEYIGFRLLASYLKEIHGVSRLREIFKECIELELTK